MTNFVYPGYVKSRNDGDQHFVTGAALIRLYRLDPRTTVIVRFGHERRALPSSPDDRHFHPRYDGEYEEPR